MCDKLIEQLIADCPNVLLTWVWGNYELQVEKYNGELTYFLADTKRTEIIEEGTVTDIEKIRKIIQNGPDQRW